MIADVFESSDGTRGHRRAHPAVHAEPTRRGVHACPEPVGDLR